MNNQPDLPKQFDKELFEALLQALRELSGTAPARDVTNKTADLLNLTTDQRSALKTGQHGTEFGYRLRWTKYALQLYGLIESPQLGIWALTTRGWQTKDVDVADILRVKKERSKPTPSPTDPIQPEISDTDILEEIPGEQYRTQVLNRLKKIDHYVFEQFCKDLLRQLDIDDVKVTPMSRDGGIDGSGVIKVNDIIGMKLAFQCKRYADSVSSPDIQRFKGAFQQDYEKGLFITTGVFTEPAKEEAEKAPRVDLIDGELLIDKMTEKRMGIRQTYELDAEYFANFES